MDELQWCVSTKNKNTLAHTPVPSIIQRSQTSGDLFCCLKCHTSNLFARFNNKFDMHIWPNIKNLGLLKPHRLLALLYTLYSVAHLQFVSILIFLSTAGLISCQVFQVKYCLIDKNVSVIISIKKKKEMSCDTLKIKELFGPKQEETGKHENHTNTYFSVSRWPAVIRDMNNTCVCALLAQRIKYTYYYVFRLTWS